MITTRLTLACALLPLSCGAGAQNVLSPAAHPAPQNVLQLSASGNVQVQQDLLSITLAVTRDGADAASVQSQLKSVLETALAEARKSGQAGQFEVRTGDFSLSPRTNRNDKIIGWQGRAELLLEGRDFARLSQVAGQLTALNISQISFGLSREQRGRAEQEAQTQAIGAFRQKAAALAKGFGFSSYTLREVAVNANQGPLPARMMRLRESAASSVADSAPVPVEPGKTDVTVDVSGSVQLVQ